MFQNFCNNTGCGPIPFVGSESAFYKPHLIFDRAIDPKVASARERFEAFSHSVRDILAQRWLLTKKTYEQQNPKRIYYLSLEFLIGRSLAHNVTNLLLDPVAQHAIQEKGIDRLEVIEQEPDAGLGNGGLGRLAACFLDSMATMQLPATGYGLRYEYGMFKQSIVNGWQKETADNWLCDDDPWEIARPHEKVEIKLNCSFELRDGNFQVIPNRPATLIGRPFDRPVVGYGGRTINTLRLWAAAAPDSFNFQEFGTGDFVGALGETLKAESLTRVLYPDDSTTVGQELRFVQEYFLVACSLADLVRRFQRHNTDWNKLPEKVAIQLNDTHPSMAVAELMRILLDDARLGWDQAWELTKKSLAYTNHTLLPEALEKWSAEWFELLLPRHLEIIYEINRRLLDEVRLRFPGDEGRVERVSLVEEGNQRKIRMANLAIVGSHSTNGVAAIHSKLLRTTTVKDLAEMFPERFSNKTNGVTPRRWLLGANPALANAITKVIGERWIIDLSQLNKLKPFAEDHGFREAFLASMREAKVQFSNWLRSTSGQIVDPDTVFDCQVKRIHEYKRQLLNTLRIIIIYNRLRKDPNMEMVPRTFFFAGKAAPAYHLAKLMIKFINNLGATIDGDPAVRGRLKVVFLPEYNVSLAERLIPASDVSNQISTTGYEASGTSNMKFMMNGALTVGTRDGATIEMAEEAGEENLFLFGLTVEQVENSRGWYNPHWHYENEPETRAALDLISSDHFSQYEPGVFAPLLDTLLTHGDHYMHLADLTSYLPSARTARRTVRGSWCLGAESNPECGEFREVFERPHHRRIRTRHLEGGTMPNTVGTRLVAGKPAENTISPLAGKPAPKEMLLDVARLERDYFEHHPDLHDPNQLVSFGTSGHRGSPLHGTFTEAHILAITQAICDYRRAQGTNGPLYMGKDTHALSGPAQRTALEVLAANNVETVIQQGDGVTPTPVISRAILVYNRNRKEHLADGIVITPSHNPPEDGGFKYNPPDGGPADTDVTHWVETRANELLRAGNVGVKRVPFSKAMQAASTHQEDFILPYVRDLKNVVDMDAIRGANLKLGVDPLGGAARHYWEPINSIYGLNVVVVNPTIDPTFSFMTVDHDGKIRMDCSSPYAMARLVGLKDQFQVAFANDPDSDRHGIVTPVAGLMNPNHYLAVAIRYLLSHRPQWPKQAAVGKTLVSGSMIDMVVAKLGRQLREVPVGFKWFVPGLVNGSCCFGGEESAGASFLRRDGTVWTTDKDGPIMDLLAAEITAGTGKDPGEHYRELMAEFGNPYYTRIDAPATSEQKTKLQQLSPDAVKESDLAGEPITAKLTKAPGNQAPIGGLKVVANSGWFAARPSGTENIYKIYAESFKSQTHLNAIVSEAQQMVNNALGSSEGVPQAGVRQ